jgi:hypothetical protein
LNPFLQLAAEKKDSKNGAARKSFGPSYFVTALILLWFLKIIMMEYPIFIIIFMSKLVSNLCKIFLWYYLAPETNIVYLLVMIEIEGKLSYRKYFQARNISKLLKCVGGCPGSLFITME